MAFGETQTFRRFSTKWGPFFPPSLSLLFGILRWNPFFDGRAKKKWFWRIYKTMPVAWIKGKKVTANNLILKIKDKSSL